MYPTCHRVATSLSFQYTSIGIGSYQDLMLIERDGKSGRKAKEVRLKERQRK